MLQSHGPMVSVMIASSEHRYIVSSQCILVCFAKMFKYGLYNRPASQRQGYMIKQTGGSNTPSSTRRP